MVKVTPCEQKKKSYVGVFLDSMRISLIKFLLKSD